MMKFWIRKMIIFFKISNNFDMFLYVIVKLISLFIVHCFKFFKMYKP